MNRESALVEQENTMILRQSLLCGFTGPRPLLPVHFLIATWRDKGAKTPQLEQWALKIESYVICAQYLRLESFHDDLVLKENLADLAVVKKYLFICAEGLSLNLSWPRPQIITDKKWFLVILSRSCPLRLNTPKEYRDLFSWGQPLH